MLNEVDLVKRIKIGESAAFEELYKQQYLALKSYARLLLGQEESDDIIQDAFLNLWMHRELLDESLSVRGYLFRSVYNAALNVLRKNKRLETYDNVYRQRIEELGAQFYNPDTNETIMELYTQDMRIEINKAIESLTPRCREVFSLSYLYDLSGKEISEKLNISLSTVENHIHAALKGLRKKLINQRNNPYIALAMLILNDLFFIFHWVF